MNPAFIPVSQGKIKRKTKIEQIFEKLLTLKHPFGIITLFEQTFRKDRAQKYEECEGYQFRDKDQK